MNFKNILGLPPDYEPCVYVIDDDESVRSSIECLVESMGFISESYESCEAFRDNTEPNINGCVLTDLRLIGCNGLELIIQMKTSGYHVPVILMSGHLDVTLTVDAITKGALSVLQKPYSEQELWDKIIAAIKFDCENCIARSWLRKSKEKLDTLSDDERVVMDLLLEGHANKYIAHSLDLSERTVSMRRKAILEKLDVNNIVDLAKFFTKLKLSHYD
jgi:FixJ family two-component response regulator